MVAKTSRTYIAVFMTADILALPGDFVVGKITRIREGFFLVSLKLQTEAMPCLTAYWMSCALVLTFSFSIIRYLWYSIVWGVR